MPERAMIGLLIVGPALWMLGGWGWKPARRIVWPLLAGLLLLTSHAPGWRIALVSLSLFLTLLLPYGDRTTAGRRPLVFASYALPAWWLSLHLWYLGLLLCGGGLSVWYWLTRRWNAVSWKTWEALAGFLQAVTLIVATGG